MKFIQVAHAVTKDDAASRHVINMDSMLRELGFATAIYAPKADPVYGGAVRPMQEFQAAPEDIVIYQMTTGTSFNKWVYNYPQKIVLYYHNITPAKFFFGNAWGSWWKCLKGRRDLEKIAKNSFFAWGASEYSRRELTALGLRETAVMPQVVDPRKYETWQEVPALYEKYRDGRLNLIMVGRVVPHKKQDEAIAMAAWYKKHLSDRIRLFIIGGTKPGYEKKLRHQVSSFGLQDNVIFTGKISNEELCTYYRLADGLLCLSEHEGFCVPLVEAMVFGTPVFAYACAAVPETLGRAGVLIKDKSPEALARVIEGTMQDRAQLEALRAGQQQRLEELSYQNILAGFSRDVKRILELKNGGRPDRTTRK